MRHFRSFRGSRRRNGPRPNTRTAKYIVIAGPQSDAAGTVATTMAMGVDLAVLGQTGPTDTAIPTGARIESFEIFMPKVNLGAATANFVTWTIQHTKAGQALLPPLAASGDSKRTNIILTGVVGLGTGQNNNLHIKFRVPRRFQRIADGDAWTIMTDQTTAVSTIYYIIYKVIM